MTFSYKSQSGAEPLRKRVVISQTSINSLQCEARETGGGPAYTIDLSKFVGDFGYHPNPGEEWIICQILGLWTLERRTSFQNNTTTALQASSPGTTIFSNHGTLQFVDTQVQVAGSSLIANGSTANATGSIILWPTATAPSGYVRCNGASISRTTYANLFSVIGLTFNGSAAAGVFNVPTLTDPATGIHYIIKT